MIVMRSASRLDIGLSSLLQCALPSVTDRETRTHRRGLPKRSYGHCRRRRPLARVGGWNWAGTIPVGFLALRDDGDVSGEPVESAGGRALEELARARHLEGDYPGSIAAHESSFAAYREEGDLLGAARSARIVSWLTLNVFSDFAVAAGWLARAERLLEEAGGPDAERGWIALARATRQPYGDERERLLREALALGRPAADPDLEFAAMAHLGEALALTGRVEEGMALFDEALAAVCAGEVGDLYVVEAVFCGMFLACERVHDVVRAEQWLRTAGDLIRRRGVVAVGPLCRAHYGGILTAAGRWDEAEAELDEAALVFERGYAGARAIVLLRLADLRLRQGRVEEAAVLLEGLGQVPDAARPLAALHLARGEPALAREVIERRLAIPAFPAPWPIAPTNPAPPPVAGPLLALLADACLALGAREDAADAIDRLAELASRNGTAYLRAAVALSRGRVCVATGSPDAPGCFRDAVATFAEAQMPLDLASARLALAEALAVGNPEVAVSEAKQALEAFDRAQATRDADRAAALLRSLGAGGRSAPRAREPLTAREAEVLDLLGHGLSNPEIAERLFISRRTVEHHVSHILSKLDLRNRAEAAAYATRAPGDQVTRRNR
jgi:DNA-binding NarL/FixJ family response regulator